MNDDFGFHLFILNFFPQILRNQDSIMDDSISEHIEDNASENEFNQLICSAHKRNVEFVCSKESCSKEKYLCPLCLFDKETKKNNHAAHINEVITI